MEFHFLPGQRIRSSGPEPPPLGWDFGPCRGAPATAHAVCSAALRPPSALLSIARL